MIKGTGGITTNEAPEFLIIARSLKSNNIIRG